MAGGRGGERFLWPLRRVAGSGRLWAVEGGGEEGEGPWLGKASSFSPGAAERFAAVAAALGLPPRRVRDWGLHELLECGHVVRVRSDHMGLTTAARRRCRHCASGHEADWPLACGWGTGEPDPWAEASRQLLRAVRRACDEGEPTARPDADAHLGHLLRKARMADAGADGGRGSFLAFLERAYGRDDPYNVRSLLEGPWRDEGQAVFLLTGTGREAWLDEASWAAQARQRAAQARQARQARRERAAAPEALP